MTCWKYITSKGPIYIKPKLGRWSIFFENEDLGSYLTPKQAADDAANGELGLDLNNLGIPEDLNEWEKL